MVASGMYLKKRGGKEVLSLTNEKLHLNANKTQLPYLAPCGQWVTGANVSKPKGKCCCVIDVRRFVDRYFWYFALDSHRF